MIPFPNKDQGPDPENNVNVSNEMDAAETVVIKKSMMRKPDLVWFVISDTVELSLYRLL